MKIYNATCMPISPVMVRRALSDLIAELGEPPTSAAATAAQIASWENCGLAVATTVYHDDDGFREKYRSLDNLRDLIRKLPRTIGGIPLVQDDSLDQSVVEFRKDGKVVARIEALAIPSAFAS